MYCSHLTRCFLLVGLMSFQAGCRVAPDRTPEFYARSVIQTIEIDIEAADLQAMNDALPDRIYVPAVFTWNDVVVSNVGIRYKGNSSSSPDQTHKRSYLVKFGEFTKGQRFLGLRRVALDNAVQFGSVFSERLLGDILAQRSVTVSRSNYARVLLNGEHHGVYVNVERIDKSFVRRYFEDPDGNLYKVDEGFSWLSYEGDDLATYAETFEAKTNKSAADISDAVGFVRDLNTLGDAEFRTWFYDRFAGEEFLELMPVMLLGGAFDQYTGFQPHNYYLFHDLTADRWTYLVWDLDVGFSNDSWVPVIDGWDASYPVPYDTDWPLLNRVAADPELLAAYRVNAQRTLEEHFEPTVLKAKLQELYDLIRDDLALDPFPDSRIVPPGDTGYDSIVATIEAFIDLRYQLAVDQLANPASAAPIADGWVCSWCGGGNEGPEPGPTSAVDPSGLTVVGTTPTRIELSWTDNSSDEAVFIVQRCSGTACEDFSNIMPIDADITSAIDANVQSGSTYRYRVYAMRPDVGFTGASNVVTASAQ